MPSPTCEILPGLSPYGPDAEPFTATGLGTHREGFVVRFLAADGTSWVGNFQPGLGSLSNVYVHPNARELLVVARGQGYVVDPDDRLKRQYFGCQIETAIVLDEPLMVIFGNGLWFEAFGVRGPQWRTPRISWDGMRNIQFHFTPHQRRGMESAR